MIRSSILALYATLFVGGTSLVGCPSQPTPVERGEPTAPPSTDDSPDGGERISASQKNQHTIAPVETGQPGKSRAGAKTGLALPLWNAAFEVDCRGLNGGVWNPLLARIARETPRAIANGPIEDADLRAFFLEDFEGYTGSHIGLLGLEQNVGRCMARLEGFELGLRESGAWVVTAETESRLLRSPAVLKQLIQVGALAERLSLHSTLERETAAGVELVIRTGDGCETESPGQSCVEYAIACPAEGSCVWQTSP